MAVSLKCLLPLLCLGIFCQSAAYSINDEAKVSQKDTVEILREIEEELEKRYNTDGAKDNEARNFDVDDEAEMNREIADHLTGRDVAKDALDETAETFVADDEAELLAMNKAIEEANKREDGLKDGTSRMNEEEFARQNDAARTDDEILKMNKGEKEERSLDKRALQEVQVDVSTPDRNEYTFVQSRGSRIVEDNSVTFGVQACNDAHIRLYSDKSINDSTYYHLVIGIRNFYSRIKVNGKQMGKTIWQRPHSCFSKCYFWASWTKENDHNFGIQFVLRVGSGRVVGENKFMEYTGSCEIPVKYVAVSTGFGATGKWTFFGHVNMINTANKKKYLKIDDLSLEGATSVTFWVQACNHGYVLLMAHQSDYSSDIYEIVIGTRGNTVSAIRKKRAGTNLASIEGQGHSPLSCDSFRPFWLSWDRTTLHVGSGSTVGSKEFLSYTDPTPTNIKYLAVSTGYGNTGKWRFDTK